MAEKDSKVDAHDFIFGSSSKMPENALKIRGFEFKKNWKYSELMASYKTTGYQASNLHRSMEIINEMLDWRLSDEEIATDETLEYKNMETRKNYKCKIFLGYTSNLVSCGLREVIKFIVESNQVDVLVSSAGGIEEDFIKCLGDTFLGAFDLDGAGLRKQGLNRIGNLIVPNDKYCLKLTLAIANLKLGFSLFWINCFKNKNAMGSSGHLPK